MKMRKLLIFSLIASCMVLTAGCSRRWTVPTKDSKTFIDETETEIEADVDENQEQEVESDELYNTYIEINNAMVGRLSDVIDSYFKYVNYQEEFVCIEDDYWCLSNNSSMYEAIDSAYELASRKTEKDVLDESYLALYPVMKEMALTFDEVEQYTDLKSYLDDDYAKAKEYHAIIWKDYIQYETLASEFMNQLSIVAAEKRMQEMESLKTDGYEGTYAILKAITTAQEIQDAIYMQGVDDSCLIELDIEALQPLYDQYVEEVQICLNYFKDEEAMAKEGFPIHSAYYVTFADRIGESKLALTELFQRVKDQRPVDEFYLDYAFPDDGTIENFNESVSTVINDYNKMINY